MCAFRTCCHYGMFHPALLVRFSCPVASVKILATCGPPTSCQCIPISDMCILVPCGNVHARRHVSSFIDKVPFMWHVATSWVLIDQIERAPSQPSQLGVISTQRGALCRDRPSIPPAQPHSVSPPCWITDGRPRHHSLKVRLGPFRVPYVLCLAPKVWPVGRR